MENLKIPNHLGIILDGNGRWAKKRGLNRSQGHKEGFETLKKISVEILNSGVKYLSVYAFSTENFKRSKEEVDFLMNLFIKKFNSEIDYFMRENVKVVFSGRLDFPLPKKVLEAVTKLTTATKDNTKGVLNICLNYGGHAEIVDATKKIINEILNNNLSIDEIDEELFSKYLYQVLPPLDLLIRTSGEERVSNFMLWQLSYAEFYFCPVDFPDFNKDEYYKALEIYTKRDRRFGAIK